MDKKTLHNLATLCRIQCSEEEELGFEKDFASILGYFNQLQELDTTDMKPLDQVVESFENVYREDEVKESLPRKAFLDNAPSQIGGMVKVPLIIKGN